MKTGPNIKFCSGFTLIDLLAVIATVAFLLVLPSVAGNRERLNRIVCLNNLRQMGMGSQLYAADDSNGRLSGSLPEPGSSQPNDDLNWLFGYGPSRTKYIQNLKAAVCPSTQNIIRTNITILPSTGYTILSDLFDNGNTPTSYGHSYEVLTRWGLPYNVPKTLNTVAAFKKTREPLINTYPGPAMVFIIFDGMDAAVSGAVNDYPNPYVGHGSEGGNMLFCDGHAEWIATKDWSYRYAVSQDSVPR